MNSKFKISIPKPCHENWNTMTLRKKGRFCGSCSKTVVDFTKKSTEEIQGYLVENKNQQVCGHFYKKQLDTIVIEIPQITFQQQLSFQKLFILALFFVMGTTLFSCQYSDGKKQKIENVILKDSIKVIEEDVGLIIPIEKLNDSLTIIKPKDSTLNQIPFCPIQKKDDIHNLKTIDKVIEVTDTVGEITIEGAINFSEEIEEDYDDDIIIGAIIQEPPRFIGSEKLSKAELKEDFDKRIQSFIEENFDSKLAKNIGLSKGKYRIQTQFVIDKTGNTTDIKVRAPHPKLKKEVIKMLKKLPQFIPGKQAGKVVKTKYTLPIIFKVE